jgi:hypothetical protein
MDTGCTPPAKYGPTGDAITRNSAAREGRTPRNRSEANMNGRRYRLISSPLGTQAASVRTSAVMAPRKSSCGSSGSAMR